jgi:hypothetical protein
VFVEKLALFPHHSPSTCHVNFYLYIVVHIKYNVTLEVRKGRNKWWRANGLRTGKSMILNYSHFPLFWLGRGWETGVELQLPYKLGLGI